MKLFYLNLACATKRRRSIEEQAGRLGLSMHRVEGLNAKKIYPVDQQPASICSTGRPFSILAPQYRPMTPGEVACFLGHREIWKRVAESDDEYCGVFEDDIWLSPECRKFLTESSWIPKGCDIVKIDTHLEPVGRIIPTSINASLPLPNFKLRRLFDYHWGAGGYVLYSRVARRLVASGSKPIVPVDDFLFNPCNRWVRKLRIFQLDPAICAHPEGLAEISVSHGFLDGPLHSFIGDRSGVAAWKPTPTGRLIRKLRNLPLKYWQLSQKSRIFGRRDRIVGWQVKLATGHRSNRRDNRKGLPNNV